MPKRILSIIKLTPLLLSAPAAARMPPAEQRGLLRTLIRGAEETPEAHVWSIWPFAPSGLGDTILVPLDSERMPAPPLRQAVTEITKLTTDAFAANLV